MPSTMAWGAFNDAAMKVGIRSAGCWPSESMVSACVKPAWAARPMPSSTADPLPRFSGNTMMRRPSSPWARACRLRSVPSVLPSTTTQTGVHCARAWRTVSSTCGPGL
ncbi:hypothetical protein FQZ97_1172570 [compost metagenome]